MTGKVLNKIMITGKTGQIGWELQRTLAPLGEVVALDRQQLNLGDPDQIREKVREIKPKIIVNAAAYTAVDKAEEEPAAAEAVNGIGPGILAMEAKRINSGIVHFSTDYVFDGTKTVPYNETDQPNPLNVYGQTKLAGEKAIVSAGAPFLIFRTSWVYGERGNNFMLTMLRLARENREIRVVDDQIGSPTWSRMIAEVVCQILSRGFSSLADKQGIYHMTAGGQTNWYGFAKAIFTRYLPAGHPPLQLTPVSTPEYKTAAARPAFSLLSNEKLYNTFGLNLPNWDNTLQLVGN